jgi:uncharacterized protein YndB with AHSA1/START domain
MLARAVAGAHVCEAAIDHRTARGPSQRTTAPAVTATICGTLACVKVLEPTDLAFFDRAALRITATIQLSASPERVFASFADPSEWPHWFPLMTSARWTKGEALGGEREVALTGLGRFRERMIAWEPGRRYAFTMIGATSPLATQLAEDYQLHAERGGTRVDWVMAATPTKIGDLLAMPTRLFMQRLFQRGGRTLEHWLSAN